MIVIYQIGSFPIYHSMVGKSGKGIQIKRGWGWDTPALEFTGIEGGVSLLPPASALVDKSKLSLSGELVNATDIKVEAALNYLKSLSGRRNIQIIGAQMSDQSEDDGPSVGISGDITWLVCDAVIDSVNVNEVWSGSDMTISSLPVTISGRIQGYWKMLSPLYWEYKDRSMSATDPHGYYSQPQLGNTNFKHPVNFNEILNNYSFFRWPSTLSDMSPTMWGNKYDGHLGGEGSDFIPFGVFNMFVDPQSWQNVNTLTAFTGVSPTDTIEIKVTKATGPFKEDLITETSSLDLSLTDADLAWLGYVGLRENDILYTGLVDPLPGYIVRDGSIISGLSLSWSYPGAFPGEAASGNVIVEYLGSLGAVAFLHDYLTY